MKPQTFFDHFERLTDSPHAASRLRELILQLAVQGKLVAQDARHAKSPLGKRMVTTSREKSPVGAGNKITSGQSYVGDVIIAIDLIHFFNHERKHTA